ncbi:MAG: hypothetical protein ABIC04_06975 [Nanoarchaeota archaeon]
MKYSELSKEDFDAVVTGELTHLAIWIEEATKEFIIEFLKIPQETKNIFKTIILDREGLTFQDKIEIAQYMASSIGEKGKYLKSLLNRIEEFKSWRNTLAHGMDVSDKKDSQEIKIEIITRAGKHKVLTITPETHQKHIKETEELLIIFNKEVEKIIKNL